MSAAADTLAPYRTLDAVLLGLVAIGTSLPFVATDPSPLWSAPPTAHAATTRFAVVLVAAVLLWGAVAVGRRPWQGVAQLGAGVVGSLAVLTGDPTGAGGALLGATAVLTAIVGACCAATARPSAP